MKTIIHLSKYFIVSLLFLNIASCSDDDDNNMNPPEQEATITETATADAELSILTAALIKTGLDATLNEEGTYTVLAPTNEAFQAAGITSVDNISEEVLTNILLNHVFNETIMATDLSTMYKNTLATGPDDNAISMYINTENSVSFNGVAAPTTIDITASNGVIHKVDAVLTIPTIVDHATANPSFSMLVEALGRLGNTYTDLLSGTDGAPFTVFAPTNEAFENLLSMLGASSLDDIDDATLEAVLTYHVVAGANATSGTLSDGQMITTAQGEDVTIMTADGVKIMDSTDTPANVVAADVQAGNGVIHAIDKVLLPQTIVDAMNPTIAGFVAMNNDYSSLLAAVQKADLVETLNAEDAGLTVFAPNNEAFATFLSDNGFASLEEVPTDVLKQVLLNHVIEGEVMSGDLTTMYGNTMATNTDGDNLSLYINTESGVMLNGVSTVTTADVEVSNGVIHAVDAVIGLPTIVTFATADPNFSSLVGALTADGQPDFVSILSGTTDAPFTVFAPLNSAFEALSATPTGATLTAVLQHHVVAGANARSEDLTDGMMVSSLEGDNITIALPGTGDAIADLTDGAGNTDIGVVAVDVQATNGVIHAVNKVLIPDTTN
ncbi:secreted/surface protein with fasciclin-like repeats [Galbibacter orientalis DSM 19592]|uniref:Secreted/surface protein with fasciclin-like repeats n=1 Tax=Galbibacter orientalis DSM 19592 TaxID=926559 RepID=I3C0Q1_9FLAO|nr:fasciclin domain-containing protein [Galbibacter orientalis]EIJ37194.1 secreted/surface protein with fasciclin-like repeats [Galbibacter orientalis DSM 19592]